VRHHWDTCILTQFSTGNLAILVNATVTRLVFADDSEGLKVVAGVVYAGSVGEPRQMVSVNKEIILAADFEGNSVAETAGNIYESGSDFSVRIDFVYCRHVDACRLD
jgi:hypothetical protein